MGYQGGGTVYLWVVFGRNCAFKSECAVEEPLSGGMDNGMVERWERAGSVGAQRLVHHCSQPGGGVPDPAAADAVIDQFCEALHNRPHCYHVFAVPLLMKN
jgi:hypothetical protein